MGKPRLTFHEDFDRFWAVYPRHQARADALKAWTKLQPDAALVEDMLTALEWQREQRSWKQGFIPLPATWLRGARWRDEFHQEPDRPFTASELAEATRVRKGWGRCEHEPVCETYKQCLARLIRVWRAYSS